MVSISKFANYDGLTCMSLLLLDNVINLKRLCGTILCLTGSITNRTLKGKKQAKECDLANFRYLIEPKTNKKLMSWIDLESYMYHLMN